MTSPITHENPNKFEAMQQEIDQQGELIMSWTHSNWKVFSDVGTACCCLGDFFFDIMSAQSLAHGHVARHMGYIAGGCLCATMPINFYLVRLSKQRHLGLFQELKKKQPIVHNIVQLLAMTNSEVLLVSLRFAQPHLSKEQKIDASIAMRKIKQYGLISQLTEDVPQITIQVIGAWLQSRNGHVNYWIIASIVWSFGMLLFKLVGNVLLWLLNVSAAEGTVAHFAHKHHLAVRLNHLEKTDFMLLGGRLFMFVVNLLFVLALRSVRQLLFEYDGISMTYEELSASTFVFTYTAALVQAFAFIRTNRDLAWHGVLDLPLMSFLVILSTLYPPTVVAISPHLRKPLMKSTCQESCFMMMPAIRYVFMGGLAGYGVWKSHFPVSENICIAVAILNAIFLLQFFLSMDDLGESGPYQQLEDSQLSTTPLGLPSRSLQRFEVGWEGELAFGPSGAESIPTVAQIDEADESWRTNAEQILKKGCLEGEIAHKDFVELLARAGERLDSSNEIYRKAESRFTNRKTIINKFSGQNDSTPLQDLLSWLDILRESGVPREERKVYVDTTIRRIHSDLFKTKVKVSLQMLFQAVESDEIVLTSEHALVSEIKERYIKTKYFVDSVDNATRLDELMQIQEALCDLQASDEDMKVLRSKILAAEQEREEEEQRRKREEELRSKREEEEQEAFRKKKAEEARKQKLVQEKKRQAEEERKTKLAEAQKVGEEEEEGKKKAAAPKRSESPDRKAKAPAPKPEAKEPDNEAASETPTKLEDLLQIASQRLAALDSDGAIACLDEYLQLVPASCDALRMRGAARMQKGDFESVQRATGDLRGALHLGSPEAKILLDQCEGRIAAAMAVLGNRHRSDSSQTNQ